MRVVADEGLVDFDGPDSRGDDLLPATVSYRVDQIFFAEVSNGSREMASLWPNFIASRRSDHHVRRQRVPRVRSFGARHNIVRNLYEISFE